MENNVMMMEPGTYGDYTNTTMVMPLQQCHVNTLLMTQTGADRKTMDAGAEDRSGAKEALAKIDHL
jgi:hypothetical protein